MKYRCIHTGWTPELVDENESPSIVRVGIDCEREELQAIIEYANSDEYAAQHAYFHRPLLPENPMVYKTCLKILEVLPGYSTVAAYLARPRVHSPDLEKLLRRLPNQKKLLKNNSKLTRGKQNE